MTTCLITPHRHIRALQVLVINFEIKGAWEVMLIDPPTSIMTLTENFGTVLPSLLPILKNMRLKT